MEIMVDTYITVEDADTYIASHFRSNNKDRIRWAALANEDKEALLLESCSLIELLPFKGRKAIYDQAMVFPRLPIQYGHTDEGAPKRVKHAQIELALWLSDEEKRTSESKRQELQEQGVTSFSVGDLSENYKEGDPKQGAYKCSKAMNLLSVYLNGGYTTC